jgi:hypothetical protein
MTTILASKDSTYVLNYCAKYLARDNTDSRHNYGQYGSDDPRGRISEAWRFPIIDSYYDGKDYVASYQSNIVTFIYVNRDGRLGDQVGVIGTFSNFYAPLPLTEVPDTVYWAATVVVPKGQWHRYKFLVGSRAMLDPINPQQVTMPDGSQWSRFFTDYCTENVSFERWEVLLLERLTDRILPFRTIEGQRFLGVYFDNLDRQTKDTQYARVYRLDQPVGAANFIDKIVAREESHRLVDYKICLELIDGILRQRNPYQEPSKMPVSMYDDLFSDMANDDGHSLQGWDYSRYASPKFFLGLLRRHTYTGAFAHPKHGGNSGAAGWAYLAQNLRDPITGDLPDPDPRKSFFDWARALEPPLGRNKEYRG